MKMGTMKRIIWLALVMALTVSVALADEQDLRQYAEDSLTEVYGYLEEEVRDFVFETRQDGSGLLAESTSRLDLHRVSRRIRADGRNHSLPYRLYRLLRGKRRAGIAAKNAGGWLDFMLE